jgi:predicted ATPase
MSSDPPRKNETANRAGEHAISRQGRLLHCGDLAAEHRRQGSVSSPEAVKAYDRAIAMMDEAERLGEQPEDRLAYFAAGFGFWLTSHVTADHAMALRRAEQFMARAERQRDSTPFLIAYRIKGISLTMSGQLEAGREEFTRAIRGYIPEVHRPLAARFAVDFGISALVYRALATWLLGLPAAALKDADEALRGARELGQAGQLMHTLFHTAVRSTSGPPCPKSWLPSRSAPLR